MILRDYQDEIMKALATHIPQYKQPLIVSATGGAGKSLVIAETCALLNQFRPTARILCVADRKELLEQNESKFSFKGNIGVVSAGLGREEYGNQITIGGIQSIYNKKELLGEIDYILIDECDLVSNNKLDGSMYWTLINSYPNAKIIGFSGTCWRTGEGQLNWGKIICNITYKQLLEKSYLAPVTSQVKAHIDKSEWVVRMGEYTSSTIKKEYIDKNSIKSWVDKLELYGKKRNHWLVFMPSVETARDMAFALGCIKVRAEYITGKTPQKERDKKIKAFKDGEIQALVGVGVFERGFDAPIVDFIADFNPTKSLKKWLQRLWRGVRIAEGKKDLLYADFAGNIREFGSINNVEIGLSELGVLTVKRKITEKICPVCETTTPVSGKKCIHCEYEFLIEKQEKKAFRDAESELDINSEKEKKKLDYSWCIVKEVKYEMDYIAKSGIKIAVMAIYTINSGTRIFNSIWDENKTAWLGEHGHTFGQVDVSKLKVPKKIQVDFTENYPKVIDYEW
jgi:DNA repair protein RadD